MVRTSYPFRQGVGYLENEKQEVIVTPDTRALLNDYLNVRALIKSCLKDKDRSLKTVSNAYDEVRNKLEAESLRMEGWLLFIAGGRRRLDRMMGSYKKNAKDINNKEQITKDDGTTEKLRTTINPDSDNIPNNNNRQPTNNIEDH